MRPGVRVRLAPVPPRLSPPDEKEVEHGERAQGHSADEAHDGPVAELAVQAALCASAEPTYHHFRAHKREVDEI